MRRLSTISLAIVVAYTLVRGLLLIGLTPPFQGPDEPGHVEYAAVLGRDRQWPPLADDAYEARVLQSMARHRFYELLSLPRPTPEPSVFADVDRLGTAPTQLESESPIGYLPYALAYMAGQDDPIESAVRRMRLASLLLAAFVVIAAAWSGREALGPLRGLAVAALVAATPMLAFGGAVVNNDLTAAALCAVWFGILARCLRRGPTWRQVLALIALAVLAVLAKRTALYLLPTLLILLLIPGTGLLRALLPSRDKGRRWVPTRDHVDSRGVALLVALFVAIGLVWLWPVEGSPADWQRSGRHWGDTRVLTAARSGSHGFSIADSQTTEWQYLEQTQAVAGGDVVNASAWVRSDEPGTTAQLVVSDDSGTWLADSEVVSGEWVRLTAGGTLAPDAGIVRLAIVPGTGEASDVGALNADDVSLVVDGSERLTNGGAESPRRLGGLLVSGATRYTDAARVLRAAARGMLDPVASAGRTARAATFMFRSYWGGFGWLTVWPPAPLYALGLVLTAVVVAGVATALLAPRRVASDERAAVVLRAFAVAALGAVVVTALGSVAGRGVEGIPQGRYLLTALVPLLVPAVAVVDHVAPRRGLLAYTGLALVTDVVLVVWVIWPAFRPQL